MLNFDVLVIGAGPAGSKCAIDLGLAGKKVALIEKEAVGGLCLNHGCIPSKTYLYLVELLESIQKAKRHGIQVGEPKVIWEEAKKRKDLNVKMLGAGLTQRIKSSGVAIVTGEATFLNDHEVQVGDQVYHGDKIVIAFGSRPLFLPITPAGRHVISTTEILDLETIPKSLVIIGGGVTGVEIASVFSALGTQVTIIEKLPALLPEQDREIAAHLKTALEKKGCRIVLGSEVLSAKDQGEGAEVRYRDSKGQEQQLLVDKALVVIGRVVNYKVDLLNQLGIKHNGRHVQLNEHLQTSLPHFYLIGDIAMRHLTAYAAEKEGEYVAAHIVGGHSKPFDYDHMPATIFSHPEVGAIGMTEEKAKAQGLDYIVKKSSYAANAKAVIMGSREGLVKMIFEKSTGKLLGVHIVGVHATDLIHQALVPYIKKMTLNEWKEMIWSHPVLSEVFKDALEVAGLA